MSNTENVYDFIDKSRIETCESTSSKSEFKVGDIVVFEDCWEDEAGHYHDEKAEIVGIWEDGTLVLNWLVEDKSVRQF